MIRSGKSQTTERETNRRLISIQATQLRRFSTLVSTLGLLLVAIGFVSAQETHPSHRLLAMDANTLSRLKSQAAMLQRLRQLSGAFDDSGLFENDDASKQRMMQTLQESLKYLASQPGMAPENGGPSFPNPAPGQTPQEPSSSLPGQQPGGGNWDGLMPEISEDQLDSLLDQIQVAAANQGGRNIGNGTGWSNGSKSGSRPGAPPRRRGSSEPVPGNWLDQIGDGDFFNQDPNAIYEATGRNRMTSAERRAKELEELRKSKSRFTDRLTQITDLARVQSLGGEEGGTNGESGSRSGNSSWLKTAFSGLEKAALTISEQAQEMGNNEPEPNRPNGRHQAGSPGRTGYSRAESDDGSWSSWIPESPANWAAPSGSGLTGGDSLSVYPFILLAVGVALLVVFFVKKRDQFEMQMRRRESLQPFPSELKERSDIVLAFHALTARHPNETRIWWTHSRAAAVLAEAKPERSSALKALAELYEQSRYLPENVVLTDRELDRAREALRRCRES